MFACAVNLTYLPVTRRSDLRAAISSLRDAQRDGSIGRSAYAEMRRAITSSFEEAFSRCVIASAGASASCTLGDDKAERVIVAMTPAFHRLPSQIISIDMLDTTSVLKDSALLLLREMEPVINALAAIRKTISPTRSRVSVALRRAPLLCEHDVDQRLSELAAKLGERSSEVMLGVMTTMHERILKDYLRALSLARSRGQELSVVDFYGQGSLASSGYKLKVVSDLVRETGVKEERVTRVRSGKSDLIRQMAERTVNEVRSVFCEKAMQPLGEIVGLKNNPSAINLLGCTVRRDGFFCNLSVRFADRTSFRARAGLTWTLDKSEEISYQPFLSFHNVILHDGTKVPHSTGTTMRRVLQKTLEAS